MIFQEPMTSLNPLHTVEKQIGEVLIAAQADVARAAARGAHAGAAASWSASPTPEQRLTPIRTSSPAASASA